MLNLNASTLAAVIAQALQDAAAHPRWVNAIKNAERELAANPWIERGDHGLVIGSTSGKAYAANGVCQCLAFDHGQPCWHRAAARLVRLHDERIAAQQQAEQPPLVDRAELVRRAQQAAAELNDLCFA